MSSPPNTFVSETLASWFAPQPMPGESTSTYSSRATSACALTATWNVDPARTRGGTLTLPHECGGRTVMIRLAAAVEDDPLSTHAQSRYLPESLVVLLTTMLKAPDTGCPISSSPLSAS